MRMSIDFGYLWPWTHGHLLVAAAALMLCGIARFRRWPRWLLFTGGAVFVWSVAAFLVVHFAFGMNRRMELPTQSFLASPGPARILDMGAGSGRSTLMVLEARPQTTVVALDSFSEQYTSHFGATRPGQTVLDAGAQRLLNNLRAAGVAERATIQAGDMRELPFAADSFDGIVSTYAIDHLNREGRDKALREAARVLRPGKEFLLMIIAKDFWLNFAYGPLFMHGHKPSQARWAEALRLAGFEVVEQGIRPGTFYFVARKK